MRIPNTQDFEELTNWGLVTNPLVAISDYSEEKEEQRWDNDRHCTAHQEYKLRRKEMQDTQEYYRNMSRPIDRTKWEYLKKRKSWYICPVGWERFAGPNVSRILDLGCGDGDVTQRIADYIAGRWLQSGYHGYPLEIVGVDLNESRIENAKSLTSSPHPKISLKFETGDASKGLQFEDNYFDYIVCTGVMEILPDRVFSDVLDEISRLCASGIFVEDLLDKYPGGYPRQDIDSELEKRGLEVEHHHKVFQEPFAEEGTLDPLGIWPMCLIQILFASQIEPTKHKNRW